MKNIFGNKKGQSFTIQSIGQIAIALLVVVIIIGLSTTILEKIKKTADDDGGNTGNISLTWVANNTAIDFGGDERLTGGGTVFNGTGDANVIPNTLWTIFLNSTIVFTNNTNQTGWDTANFVLNANTLIGSSSFNITGLGIDGQGTLAEFVPTIAIIAIAAVVIGIVLVFFGRRKET